MTVQLVFAIATSGPNALGAGPAPTARHELPVLSAGRLGINRRFDVVIDAFRGVHHQFTYWRLAIIGDRPLITEARLDVLGQPWGPTTPILNATSVDEVHDQLVRCEDLALRERIAEAGHEFALEHLYTEAVYQRLREAVLVASTTSAPT
jgi:hypothetical protein